MTGRAILSDLSTEQRLMLRLLEPRTALRRPGHAGEPFRIDRGALGTRIANLRVDEATVLDMVARGLMTVTQAAAPIQGRRDASVPFSVILSRAGEAARGHELKERPWAANDAAWFRSAA